MKSLKEGDILVAKSSDYLDAVTKGKEYEVVTVFKTNSGTSFRIINDKGNESMPLWVSFEKRS